MFKGSWGLIAVAMVAAAVAIAGCGGGGSDEPLTKAEFIKQANAICQQSAERRSKLIAEFIQQANPKANREKLQEEVVQRALPTYETATQQIDELAAPQGDDEKVQKIVEAMEEAVKKAEADPHSALINEAAFKKADQLVKSYGLKDCNA